MGSKSKTRRRREPVPPPARIARGSSATIQPLACDDAMGEPSDAIPVRTDDSGDRYIRVALEVACGRRADALTVWNAMCRVEQMLRERRGS